MTVLIEVEALHGLKVNVQLLNMDQVQSIRKEENLALDDSDEHACTVIMDDTCIIHLKQSFESFKRQLSGNGIKIIRG